MEMNKDYRIIVLACALFAGVSTSLFGAEVKKEKAGDLNRFFIFFNDKSGSQYSLDNPRAFLSEKSIARREKNDVLITEEDLPVVVGYITAVQNSGAKVYYASKWLNGVLVEMDSSTQADVTQLDFVKESRLIAPGSRLTTELSTVEPTTSWQDVSQSNNRNSKNTKSQNGQIGIDDMHKKGYDGSGIFVAVFDAGFSFVNKSAGFQPIFEEGRLIDAFDFVTYGKDVYRASGHGTNVLSCIGGKYKSTYAGGAYKADFALYITEDISTEHNVEEYNWLIAAERADSLGVDIINSSLGYYSFDNGSSSYQHDDLDGNTAIVSKAADIASSKGILVVVSAGNEGTGSWGKITVPADVESTLAVGAVNANRAAVSFSSPGPTADGRIKPDIAALGSQTVVFNSSGKISTASGTSFAAPLIAGLAAGLMDARPELSAQEIKKAIIASGHLGSSPSNRLGHGVPNFSLAFDPSVILDAEDIFENEIEIFPNPIVGNTIFLRFGKNKLKLQDFEITVFNTEGKLVGQQVVKNPRRSKDYKMELSSEGPGVYIIEVKSGPYQRNIKLLKL